MPDRDNVSPRCEEYYINVNDPDTGLTKEEQDMIQNIIKGNYIEDPTKQLHLGVYLTILIVTLILISMLLAAIIHNSWLYGYKQYKFRESYFLAGFYLSAGINMIV